MGSVEVFVPGTPAPQGSKRYLGNRGGRGILVESASTKVKSWRADVREAATGLVPAPVEGAVSVAITFLLARPRSVPVARRPLPIVKPDIDKLLRSTLDALKSAGVYGDDAQVVHTDVTKVYADGVNAVPGALIRVDADGLP